MTETVIAMLRRRPIPISLRMNWNRMGAWTPAVGWPDYFE
jgi:hypothetical protein